MHSVTAHVHTASQERFLDILKNTRRNIFLTGAAGTGKSFVLKEAKQWLSTQDLKHIVVAFTGAAAYDSGGRTIHSTFAPMPLAPTKERRFTRLPASIEDTVFGVFTTKDTCPTLKIGEATEKWIAIDTLFIEEVSMVDVGLFSVIDACLKRARGNNASFGGIRLIVVGDFLQLRPISPTPGTPSASLGMYAFEPWTPPTSKEGHRGVTLTPWANAQLVYCPLRENVRQKDDTLLRDVCQQMRTGVRFAQWPERLRAALEELAKYGSFEDLVAHRPQFETATRIYWANDKRNLYNNQRNNALESATIMRIKPTIWMNHLSGPRPTAEECDMAMQEVTDFLEASDVSSKWPFNVYVGTKLMVIRNRADIPEHFNGKMGSAVRRSFKRLADDTTVERLVMSTGTGELEVPAITDKVEYTYPRPTEDGRAPQDCCFEISFTYFPVTLAFALSYHKVQGKTLVDPIILMANTGMGRASGANMMYTGMTRATDIGNIAILCDKEMDDKKFRSGLDLLEHIFYTDKAALDFYRHIDAPTRPSAWPPRVGPHAHGRCAFCGGEARLLFRPCMHAIACKSCTRAARDASPGASLTCLACGSAVCEVLEMTPWDGGDSTMCNK
jgi:hypothetical protein